MGEAAREAGILNEPVTSIRYKLTFECSSMAHRHNLFADPERGGQGVRTPLKNVGFLSNIGLDCLKITNYKSSI